MRTKVIRAAFLGLLLINCTEDRPHGGGGSGHSVGDEFDGGTLCGVTQWWETTYYACDDGRDDTCDGWTTAHEVWVYEWNQCEDTLTTDDGIRKCVLQSGVFDCDTREFCMTECQKKPQYGHEYDCTACLKVPPLECVGDCDGHEGDQCKSDLDCDAPLFCDAPLVRALGTCK
jgi:hypothetical protein